LDHFDLGVVEEQLLDHIVPNQSGGTFKLKLDLLDARVLAPCKDPAEILFRIVLELLRGFAHHLKSLLHLGVRGAATEPSVWVLPGSAWILAEARVIGVSRTPPEAAAPGRRLRETALIGVGDLGLATSTARSGTLPAGVGVLAWSTAAEAQLSPQLAHLLVEPVGEALDLGLLICRKLELSLDGGIGSQHERRSEKASEPARPAEESPWPAPASSGGALASAAALRLLCKRIERQDPDGNHHRRRDQCESKS
jgi:hypothetical protein